MLFAAPLALVLAADLSRPLDPKQALERTCFQCYAPFSERINVRSDVVMVYGIDKGLSERIRSWRERGYRIHVMTGVSWGEYQDYLYGRFDGKNHEDEAQTDRNGDRISHGGDVYYMSPGESYGKFLCVGVQRALDAGAEAIHLEEPEFWVRAGYGPGFRREWQSYFCEAWQPPHESCDAQWRASKLKYYLYRRALQQVFDHVQAYNRKTGRNVRCYVPTHSLLNYATWRIVSPESSLARLNGCDGYVAQVWTGTSRTPNVYRGVEKERTFETAFLEYRAMQNLVRATGRRVWYLNDPVEDDPSHDWGDYRRNWESTLVASLLQAEVWRYETMPWPDRIFTGRYPSEEDPSNRIGIPPAYATEIQTVVNALNDMNQRPNAWVGERPKAGVVVSDSLMFQRGGPSGSDGPLSHFYGLALPLVKRGVPVDPVQLENAPLKGALRPYDLLLMSYQGMKPLGAEVHPPLAAWVRAGGVLIFWDDDSDPFNGVREWWNQAPMRYRAPREHLFEALGLGRDASPGRHAVGKGVVLYRRANPVALAYAPDGDRTLVAAVQGAIRGSRVRWGEHGDLVLRRGKYVVAAGLDESVDAPPRRLDGRFVNLFDPGLRAMEGAVVVPGARLFLLDLDKATTPVLASACKVWKPRLTANCLSCVVEGIAGTRCVLLARLPRAPKSAVLGDKTVAEVRYDSQLKLAWLTFDNSASPRELRVLF